MARLSPAAGARKLCYSLDRWTSLETWHATSLYFAAGWGWMTALTSRKELGVISISWSWSKAAFPRNQLGDGIQPMGRETSTCRWANMCPGLQNDQTC